MNAIVILPHTHIYNTYIYIYILYDVLKFSGSLIFWCENGYIETEENEYISLFKGAPLGLNFGTESPFKMLFISP